MWGSAASSACLDMPLGRLNHPETEREGVYCTLSSVGCLGHELNVSMSISPVFIYMDHICLYLLYSMSISREKFVEVVGCVP